MKIGDTHHKLIYENFMVDPKFFVNFISLIADFKFWFSFVIDSVKKLFIIHCKCYYALEIKVSKDF